MVSPQLTKISSSESLEVSESVRRLFQVIYSEQNREEKTDNEPKIRVSEMISKMAFYYEKIRNSVDYNEEYLLRKDAIERILKRQIVIEGVVKVYNGQDIALHLLTELIRAGYLPNNKVPEKKAEDVARIIEKFVKLRNNSLSRFKPSNQLKTGNVGKAKDEMKEKSELARWLLALAASEIEDSLGLDKEKEAVVEGMFENLSKIIKLPSGLSFEKDLRIQIYLGIARNYLRFDKDMQSFILFKYFNPIWANPGDEDIVKISQSIMELKEAIDYQLEHPLTKQLNKIIGRQTVYFSILSDVIRDNPNGVYQKIKEDPKAVPRLIKQVCNKRYTSVKAKLWRAAVRSIIYIFITKSFLVLLLEIPAIKLFGEEVNSIALIINVVFPAFLLFFIVFFTKVPGDDNSEKIIEGVKEISFVGYERSQPIILRQPAKSGGVIQAIFSIFYSITFFISFGAVVWILDKINFNWVSITIFLFFLAFVSFFSIRIRKNTKELFVIDAKENIVGFLIDFFYVPIILAGKWISERVSRVNVLVFAMDFIIEAPFKIFVDIAEQWTRYVRDRKDDIN